MIYGLSHITLAVSDLKRSIYFYESLLGFRVVYKSDKCVYFEVGNLWFCLVRDNNTRKKPMLEYTHTAFKIDKNCFEKMILVLEKAGVKQWQHNTSEGESFYFLDPDGHKLELHVGNLRSRLSALDV